MKLLIGYATTEGQTRKICRHIAEHLIDGGHSVELLPLAEADDLAVGRFDRVILAASVHAGHYQRPLSDFVTSHAKSLDMVPTLFLSVSLAAAGHDAEDWKALDSILSELTEATGWVPDRVDHVAGSYMPSKYDLVRRFIMRRIIAAKDPEQDLDADHEYTDWAALNRAVTDWLES